VEDQEPDHEGHAVSRKVERLGEGHFLEAVQPEDPRFIASELARPGEGDADAHRYDDERQRLLQQVRPALALPRPPADHVAHRRSGEPSGRSGLAGRDVQQLADEVGELGRGQRQHSGGREADQPPAALGAHQLPHWPRDHPPEAVTDRGRVPDWGGAMHARPRVIQAFGSVRHGIQYGNLWRSGKRRIPRQSAAHPQLPRSRPRAPNPALPSPGYKTTIVTDKAGARS